MGTLAAIASLVGMYMGLYELATGRLTPMLTRLRRRVPATATDLRDNAVALVLNEIAVLLMAILVLTNLLFIQARINPAHASAAFFIFSLAGFLAAIGCALASFWIKFRVQMVSRTNITTAADRKGV